MEITSKDPVRQIIVTSKSQIDVSNSSQIHIFITYIFFLGYVVEKCEDGKDFWEKVPGLVNGTAHPVKGLKEGKKYKFRVKAENKYGAGAPLETDKSILAKNPFGKFN